MYGLNLNTPLDDFFRPGFVTTITGGPSWFFLNNCIDDFVAYDDKSPALYLWDNRKSIYELQLEMERYSSMAIQEMPRDFSAYLPELLDTLDKNNFKYVYVRWAHAHGDVPIKKLIRYAQEFECSIVVHTTDSYFLKQPAIYEAWSTGKVLSLDLKGPKVVGRIALETVYVGHHESRYSVSADNVEVKALAGAPLRRRQTKSDIAAE